MLGPLIARRASELSHGQAGPLIPIQQIGHPESSSHTEQLHLSVNTHAEVDQERLDNVCMFAW